MTQSFYGVHQILKFVDDRWIIDSCINAQRKRYEHNINTANDCDMNVTISLDLESVSADFSTFSFFLGGGGFRQIT